LYFPNPEILDDQIGYGSKETVTPDYLLDGKREKMKRMKENPYFNVVQVKYAYAVTCHKAQGRHWKTVFFDLSYVPREYLGVDFYRWLYTAFTRAMERIFLINPAKELLME
jgi:exodeoxyribonuclease-5